MPLTLDELERRAYADGDVERAALLATAADGSAELQEELDQLRHENEMLNAEIGDMQDEIDTLKNS